MSNIHSAAQSEYRKFLTQSRIGESEVAIPNRMPWQSRMATEELLLLAKARVEQGGGYVRLLTGGIPERVYDANVRAMFKELHDSSRPVKVIVWNEAPAEPLPKIPGVEIRYRGSRNPTVNHFLVVDDLAYRYEAVHPYFEDKSVTDFGPPVPARICFNDRPNATSLQKMFDKVWDHLTPAT